METEKFKCIREISNFILVEKDGMYGLLDKQGNVLVPCTMNAFYISDDFDYCFFEKDGLRGAYCKELGYAAPIYDNIDWGVGEFHAVLEGMTGYLNKSMIFVPADIEISLKPNLLLKEEILKRLNEMKEYGANFDLKAGEYVVQNEMEQTIIDENGGYEIYMYGGHWD